MKKKGKLILDASSVNSDLLYKTGFIAPDPFIYFSTDGEEAVIVSVLEYERAKLEVNKGIKTFLYNDFTEPEKVRDVKSILSGLIKKYNFDCIEIPADFPVIYADYLRSLGLETVVIEGCFFPERDIKSNREKKLLENACRVVEKAMKRAENILRESTVDNSMRLLWNRKNLTSEILQREINLEIVRNDAVGKETIAASGVQSSQPHNVGSGVIKANTPIVIDIFPRMNRTGYWGDMTRTFVKGKAPEIVKDAYSAVKNAKEMAKGQIREGSIPAEIHREALSFLERAGFETGEKNKQHYGFIHSLGHGVGLDIHEKPLIGMTNKEPLKCGNAITIEPGVYYPEWGGVRLEDLVFVTKGGIECLTDYEECLEIP